MLHGCSAMRRPGGPIAAVGGGSEEDPGLPTAANTRRIRPRWTLTLPFLNWLWSWSDPDSAQGQRPSERSL